MVKLPFNLIISPVIKLQVANKKIVFLSVVNSVETRALKWLFTIALKWGERLNKGDFLLFDWFNISTIWFSIFRRSHFDARTQTHYSVTPFSFRSWQRVAISLPLFQAWRGCFSHSLFLDAPLHWNSLFLSRDCYWTICLGGTHHTIQQSVSSFQR